MATNAVWTLWLLTGIRPRSKSRTTSTRATRKLVVTSATARVPVSTRNVRLASLPSSHRLRLSPGVPLPPRPPGTDDDMQVLLHELVDEAGDLGAVVPAVGVEGHHQVRTPLLDHLPEADEIGRPRPG